MRTQTEIRGALRQYQILQKARPYPKDEYQTIINVLEWVLNQ